MQKRLLIACVWVILIVSVIRSASAQLPPENVDLFAYSPESNLIAINVRIPDASDGRGQSIAEIYDTVSGQYLGFIPAQETGFIYLQFNATGDRLTTVTADNFVDTWDVSTLTHTEPSLPGGAFQGGPIAWNPQNDWLAASLVRQVYISSADSPDVIIFGDEATTSGITDMRWSPDGKLLAISTYDARIETQHLTIWDTFGADPMSTGPVLRITGHRIGRLDWKPDGTAIAAPTVDGIVIYDAETGETIQRIMTDEPLGYVYEIRWSPDGRQIAIGANDILWIWDVATGAMLAHHVMPQDVKEIAWLPNGQVLHNGGEIGLAIDGTGIEGFVIPVMQPTSHPNTLADVYGDAGYFRPQRRAHLYDYGE